MLCRFVKSCLIVTLFFALQLSGITQVHAAANKQHTDKAAETSVKQNPHHHQLIAETGAEINLPALQLTVQTAAFFNAGSLAQPFAASAIYIGRPLNAPQSRFYRLILFPFHGFW
ncbi:hypothetical protein [Mucilaginibacter sp. FT3.2]|uniref:hypothetical protein n=1 Tax=Mucilaginibacter sp. FT3.2 TaxID=2723090 RepID=UPI0016214DFD|nr:hypothetical protein [Mucilaginibacter sp. FT3.2]MBB6234771.1 hypothetical protein [Mucilaginibacter sp. FT3.2]